jgi:hypothetical protein
MSGISRRGMVTATGAAVAAVAAYYQQLCEAPAQAAK